MMSKIIPLLFEINLMEHNFNFWIEIKILDFKFSYGILLAKR